MRSVKIQMNPFRFGMILDTQKSLPDRLVQIHFLFLIRQFSLIKLRDLDHIIDKGDQPLGLFKDTSGKFLGILRFYEAIVDDLCKSEDQEIEVRGVFSS